MRPELETRKELGMPETTESASWPVLMLAEDDDKEPPEPLVLLTAVTMPEMLRRLLGIGLA